MGLGAVVGGFKGEVGGVGFWVGGSCLRGLRLGVFWDPLRAVHERMLRSISGTGDWLP